MPLLKNIWKPFDYYCIDQQIEKFRQLASEYEKANRAYYGEDISSILLDQ